MIKIHEIPDKFAAQTGIRFEQLYIIPFVLVILVTYIFLPYATTFFALSLALYSAPVWLTFLMVGSAHRIWYIVKRSEFINSKKFILLEIKPPRNLVKTPLAMEAFISTLYLTGSESTWWARVKGGIRPFFSLEIASFEGKVHFFIWTQDGFRRLIESQLYAQYPGVQVTEVPDYTRLISAKSSEWGVWGCDFKQGDKDPLPIKTYVEYGLEKVQDEPEQTDPLANLIEFMGSIGKGEYLWLQMIIRAHKGEKYGVSVGKHESNKLNKKGNPYTWKDEAEELVDKIREETRQPYKDPATGKEIPGFPNPTKGQSEKIAAIERNVSKYAFDVCIRSVYLARPDKFHTPTILHLIALFNPFSTQGWNSIKSTKWMKTFDDYPWEIGTNKRKELFRNELIEAYRRRQCFYDPFFEGGLSSKDAMIMSTEELATLFHIPSRSVETPGLVRIQSATSEAPSNLPT